MKLNFKKLAGLFFVAFAFLLSGLQAVAQISQPNIVIIIGDDIGYRDLNCNTPKAAKTPNIDRLAESGMRFTNMFLTASSCSPSRASIISGRYPHNTGAPELHQPIPKSVNTLPGLLKASGYYTAASGKWHLGPDAKNDFHYVQDNDKEIGEGGEDGWAETIRSCPIGKPFFLWLAAKDAHRPWGINKFTGTNDPEKIIVSPFVNSSPTTKKDIANYYDEITRFDHFIGIVEKELKNKNVYDNTMIIIMSDNGAPYPHAKARLYDDGLRSPFIISWPGRKLKTEVCNSLLSAIDIAPTLIEIAGIKKQGSFQGKSFTSLLSNPLKPFRSYVFGEHNWHDYEAHERSVRSKDFLYILNARPQLSNAAAADVVDEDYYRELVNLKSKGQLTEPQKDPFVAPRATEEFYYCVSDPLQTNNRIDDPAFKKKVRKMRKKLAQWAKQTSDSAPQNLTPDWFDRSTGKPLNIQNRRGKTPGSINAVKTTRKGPF